jgi:hypothetical protein
MTNVKRFLTEREATLKLGINDRTFRKYRVMGLIAPVGVVGSGRFIFEADYIESLIPKFPARSRSYEPGLTESQS